MQLWCSWGKYSLPSPCTCANPLRFGSPRGCGLQHICSSPALLPLSHCSLFSRELLTIYLNTQTSLFFFPVNKQNFYFMETKMHSKGGMSRSTCFLVVVSFAVLWIFFIIVSVSLKNMGKKTQSFPPCMHSCQIWVWIKQASHLWWYRMLLHAKWLWWEGPASIIYCRFSHFILVSMLFCESVLISVKSVVCY